MRLVALLSLAALCLAEPPVTIDPILFPRRGQVEIPVRLAKPARLTLEYRSGDRWKPATAPAAEHAAGPVSLAWDSRADLPATSFAGMRVRVTADGEAPVVSGSFTLDNDRKAQLVVRDPYLQKARAGSVLLLWRTRLPAPTRVRLGDRVLARDGARTAHEIELARLEPGREYEYTVLDGDGAPLTATETFRAAPAPGAGRVKFFVLGDMGSGLAPQHELARRLAEHARDADFGIFLGDLIYPAGETELYDRKQFHVYRDLFKSCCVFVTMGNHDEKNADGFRDAWRVFSNGPSPSSYSCDYGPVHLASVDTSDEIRRKDLLWLDKDLQGSRLPLKIVFQHHPLYSARYSPARMERVRAPQAPILERNDVALFLAGHDHLYARTGPRRDYDAKGSGRPGVVHLTSGGGGAFLYFKIRRHPDAVVHKHVYHFVLCEAEGRRLKGRAIDIHGNVIDRFTIER